MKKLLFLLICMLPLNVFADEMIVNGKFNSGVTGWTVGTSHGITKVSACSTKSYSSPASCLLYANGYIPFGSNSSTGMYQAINPAVYCTLSVQIQFSDSGEIIYGDYIAIHLTINCKDSILWSRGGYYSTIGQDCLSWMPLQIIFTNNDTITGISFEISIQAPVGSSYTNILRFWIDDVSIVGSPVPAIEENSKLEIKNEKLTASPNPFTTATTLKLSTLNSKLSTLSVFDISGKLVETTDNPIIGKNLNPGVYFIKINNSTPIKIIKMGDLK